MVLHRALLALSVWSIALAVGVGLVACGGGGTTDEDSGTRTDVQKQCDALMAVWCGSAMECVWCETAEACEEKGLPPETVLTEAQKNEQVGLCIDVAKGNCDAAVDVSSSYDLCASSVETLSDSDCAAIRTAIATEDDEPVPMPSSCDGVFSG